MANKSWLPASFASVRYLHSGSLFCLFQPKIKLILKKLRCQRLSSVNKNKRSRFLREKKPVRFSLGRSQFRWFGPISANRHIIHSCTRQNPSAMCNDSMEQNVPLNSATEAACIKQLGKHVIGVLCLIFDEPSSCEQDGFGKSHRYAVCLHLLTCDIDGDAFNKFVSI